MKLVPTIDFLPGPLDSQLEADLEVVEEEVVLETVDPENLCKEFAATHKGKEKDKLLIMRGKLDVNDILVSRERIPGMASPGKHRGREMQEESS